MLISGRKKYCKNTHCGIELNEFNTFTIRKNGRYYLEAYCKECKSVLHKMWMRANYGKVLYHDDILTSLYSKMDDLEKKRTKIIGKRENKNNNIVVQEKKHCPICGNNYSIIEFIASLPHEMGREGRIIYDTCVKCAERSVIARLNHSKYNKKEHQEKENLDSVRYRKAMKKFIDRLLSFGKVEVKDITGNYSFVLNGNLCVSLKNGRPEYKREIHEVWFIYQKMLKAHFAKKNKNTWNAEIAKKFFCKDY